MAIEAEQLHFLLVPLLSQSHIIPLTEFAKLVAEKGVLVSILTTPLNEVRYQGMITQARVRNLRIQTVCLQFPGPEAGLPEGCENLDSLDTMERAGEFFRASAMLQGPLEILIQEMDQKPHCIVSTTAVSWTQAVADKFNIPRYLFETVSCFTISCSRILEESGVKDAAGSDSDPFLVPNIPHEIRFTRAQLPDLPMKMVNLARANARATLVNTFLELEPWYLEECRKERGGKVFSVGPVALSSRDSSEKYERGNRASIEQHSCLTWLDSREPKSVLYACFGSLSSITFEQMREIGMGLKSSDCPFIWIIRNSDCSIELEKWLQEEEFEATTRNRGVIIRGWAPQFLILSHPSIGGFLTHCGWNSILEGIAAGLPLMTWPMFAEQFYNEKFVVEVLGIGVRVGVEKQRIHCGDDVVASDRVEKGIRELMDLESLEAAERRRRADELARKARGALGEGGSSCVNLSLFINDVIQGG